MKKVQLVPSFLELDEVNGTTGSVQAALRKHSESKPVNCNSIYLYISEFANSS